MISRLRLRPAAMHAVSSGKPSHTVTRRHGSWRSTTTHELSHPSSSPDASSALQHLQLLCGLHRRLLRYTAQLTSVREPTSAQVTSGVVANPSRRTLGCTFFTAASKSA